MAKAGIDVKSFGVTQSGEDILLYALVNKEGLIVEIINYGGIITRILVPDRTGNLEDVVLGYEHPEEYIDNPSHFGALVGRFGNRIGNGTFELDGKTYSLEINNAPAGFPCHIHGGKQGFAHVTWEAEPLLVNEVPGLKLSYRSPAGEEGYPGNLAVDVHYWLTNNNVLRVEYRAISDAPTPVNLTQHSYFNLKGEGEGDILDHRLFLNAVAFTPVNEGMIPTGEFRSVKDTPFDFTQPMPIGARINAENEQIKIANGYDHNFIINKRENQLDLAARVFEPQKGRTLEVWTTEPGVQFYTGNFLKPEYIGKQGQPYQPHSGFCLETQHYPDSPNQKNFPSTILRPGQVYQTVTEFRFGAESRR